MLPEIKFVSKFPILGYGTTEMRCVQPARFLERSGWRTSTGCVYRDMPYASRAIVFHRLSADRMGARAIELARAQGLYLFYDVDDLIFDQDSSNHLGKFSRDGDVVDVISGYRNAMMLCDTVLCSTRYIADRVGRFHPDVVIMKNGLSQEFMDLPARIPPRSSSDPGDTILGYFSGSSHHDSDFALIKDALCRVMNDFSNVRLLLAGKIKFEPVFSSFGDRFEYRPFMPYSEFMKLPGEVDINLVPLVCSDPFAQARSELKYMEAAAFGVPSIASPTSTYVDAIEHEVTGLISDDTDWYHQLSRLINDTGFRRRLGSAAREDVWKNYSADKRKAEWNELMDSTLGAYATSRAQKPMMYKALQQNIGIKERALRRWLKTLSS